MAAAEYDYIVSGGDTSVIAADQSFFAGFAPATAVQVAPAGPMPGMVGIVAGSAEVAEAATGATTVTFMVYLTAAATSDTGGELCSRGDRAIGPGGGGLWRRAAQRAGDHRGRCHDRAVQHQRAAGGARHDAVRHRSCAAFGTDGVALLNGSAASTVEAPAVGVAPIFQLADLTSFGTFINDGNNHYTLDLGAIQYRETLPVLNFAIENAATAPADKLGVTIAADTVEGFTASGLTVPAAISAGQSYSGFTATIDTVKFGANVETVTFTPTDTNASGFTAPLPVQTLTILDTLEFPTMTYSEAWGDVHIVTYNGLKYDFQGAGEFWLAQSRIAGDSFGIQLRLQPYASELLGQHHHPGRAMRRDGPGHVRPEPGELHPGKRHSGDRECGQSGAAPGGRDGDGDLASVFRVSWVTGEIATITSSGRYINVVDGVPPPGPGRRGRGPAGRRRGAGQRLPAAGRHGAAAADHH